MSLPNPPDPPLTRRPERALGAELVWMNRARYGPNAYLPTAATWPTILPGRVGVLVADEGAVSSDASDGDHPSVQAETAATQQTAAGVHVDPARTPAGDGVNRGVVPPGEVEGVTETCGEKRRREAEEEEGVKPEAPGTEAGTLVQRAANGEAGVSGALATQPADGSPAEERVVAVVDSDLEVPLRPEEDHRPRWLQSILAQLEAEETVGNANARAQPPPSATAALFGSDLEAPLASEDEPDAQPAPTIPAPAVAAPPAVNATIRAEPSSTVRNGEEAFNKVWETLERDVQVPSDDEEVPAGLESPSEQEVAEAPDEEEEGGVKLFVVRQPAPEVPFTAEAAADQIFDHAEAAPQENGGDSADRVAVFGSDLADEEDEANGALPARMHPASDPPVVDSVEPGDNPPAENGDGDADDDANVDDSPSDADEPTMQRRRSRRKRTSPTTDASSPTPSYISKRPRHYAPEPPRDRRGNPLKRYDSLGYEVSLYLPCGRKMPLRTPLHLMRPLPPPYYPPSPPPSPPVSSDAEPRSKRLNFLESSVTPADQPLVIAPGAVAVDAEGNPQICEGFAKGKLFHSSTNQELLVKCFNRGDDSDDENDGVYRLRYKEGMLGDFPDMYATEKVFMNLWNQFMLEDAEIYGDKRVMRAVEEFVRKFGPEVRRQKLDNLFVRHCTVLSGCGLIDAQGMDTLVEKIHNTLPRTTPDPRFTYGVNVLKNASRPKRNYKLAPWSDKGLEVVGEGEGNSGAGPADKGEGVTGAGPADNVEEDHFGSAALLNEIKQTLAFADSSETSARKKRSLGGG